MTDSLADQIYTAIQFSMVTAENSLFEIWGSPSLIFNISVNRYHPDAQRLIKEAGVTADRLDRPIFNYYREHHLVHRSDMDKAFSRFHDYVSWTGGPNYAESGWVFDRSWWYDKIKEQLGFPLWMVPKNGKGAVPLEEKSMVAFSTGPHWAWHELWPKHIEGDKKNYEDMMRGFVGAVSPGWMFFSTTLMGGCTVRHRSEKRDRTCQG